MVLCETELSVRVLYTRPMFQLYIQAAVGVQSHRARQWIPRRASRVGGIGPANRTSLMLIMNVQLYGRAADESGPPCSPLSRSERGGGGGLKRLDVHVCFLLPWSGAFSETASACGERG